MSQWAFKAAAAASLMMFLAICTLWARNALGHRDSITLTAARKWSLGTVNGQLAAEMIYDRRGYFGMEAPYATRWRLTNPGELYEPNGRYLGCNRFRGTATVRAVFTPDAGWTSTTISYVAPPFWLLAWAASVLPVVHVLMAVRRRGVTGCCSRCGYDLRMTPDICPECGLSVGAGQ